MSFDDLVAAMDGVAQATFGKLVTYTPEDGDPVSTTPEGEPLTGIYSEQYELAKGGADAGVETIGPAVFLRLAELPADPEDDEPTITIAGVDYEVTRREPDGMGGIVLGLRKLS